MDVVNIKIPTTQSGMIRKNLGIFTVPSKVLRDTGIDPFKAHRTENVPGKP
jgi:hypothetical protein